jgi:hypothetical protein
MSENDGGDPTTMRSPEFLLRKPISTPGALNELLGRTLLTIH